MLSKEAAGFSTRARWIAGLSAIALLGGSLVFAWPGRFRHPQPKSIPATSSPARLRPIVPAERTRLAANFGNLPLSFEPNQGQTDAAVKFLSRNSQYNLYLTPGEAVFTLPVKSSPKNPTRSAIRGKHSQMTSEAVLRMEIRGANPAAKVTGDHSLAGHTNYLIGRDASKWVRDVPQYARVNYQDVYPNVDLTFYGQQRQLEFDFVVKPGADPASIALGIEGAKKITTDNGDLVVASAAGDLRVHKPVAYQKQGEQRQSVDARFVVKGTDVALAVGAYDRSRELVIDPTIAYGTYLGAGSEDDGSAIAVDSTGAAYITGQTASSGFPLKGTVNAPLVGSLRGTFDAFITKLSADGTALVYSTFFGGTGTDSGNAIAIDGTGQAYIAGSTNSSDLPIVGTPLKGVAGGNLDAFVAVLNPAGNTLIYSTYIGGVNDDVGNGIAVKGSVIYVVGSAGSDQTSFPILLPSGSILQGTFKGGTMGTGVIPTDGFVTKIDLSNAANDASVFLGGTANDEATGVGVDASGNAYVTGVTLSTDFPTASPFQSSCNGCPNQEDSFVTEITADFKGYGYSTYLGGSGGDDASQVVADSAGNAYVVGVTNSTNFPTNGTNAAFKTTLASGSTGNAFVTVVKAGGSSLLYSTYLGGGGLDTGLAIALDASNPPNVFVTGQTSSTNFPTVNPTQSANAGGNDAFVSEINPNVSGTGSLLFSTYLGGTADEDHFLAGIAVSNGNFYVTGDTQSLNSSTVTNFPAILSGFKTTASNSGAAACSGVCRDAFVVKFSPNTPQFSVNAGTISPNAITRGGTGTSTVTVASTGAAGAVTLACSVSSATKPPTCSLGAPSGSLTAGGSVTSTLTITTVNTGSANLTGGAALWLPLPGIAFLGAGLFRKNTTPRKWAWSVICCLALTGLLLMLGCGSGNYSGGGGGGGGGTTTGSYTVTVTGSIVGTGSQSGTASFTVQ